QHRRSEICSNEPGTPRAHRSRTARTITTTGGLFMVSKKHMIELTVNGKPREGLAEPRRTLADFLRDDLELTGTHLGCEHGVCGACTVLVNGEAVRSCLMFAVQAEGAEVTTIEGLTPADGLSPVQQAMHEAHGLQCDFCTPGFVVSITACMRYH